MPMVMMVFYRCVFFCDWYVCVVYVREGKGRRAQYCTPSDAHSDGQLIYTSIKMLQNYFIPLGCFQNLWVRVRYCDIEYNDTMHTLVHIVYHTTYTQQSNRILFKKLHIQRESVSARVRHRTHGCKQTQHRVSKKRDARTHLLFPEWFYALMICLQK